MEKPTKLPNILLILVDSFSHRKIFSQDTLTPEIDKLVNNGVYFSQATSIADATLLSTTGLFTGLYPFKTGIRSPAKNLLNKNIITFFSALEKEGYENYAFRPTLQENDDLFPNFKNEDSLYDVFNNLSDGLGEKILDELQKKKDKPWFLFIHPHDLHQPIIIPEEYRDEILDGKVKLMIMPDIESVNYGRDVGYDIIEHTPPEDIKKISGTKIRNKK